jgi:hypothetical protein
LPDEDCFRRPCNIRYCDKQFSQTDLAKDRTMPITRQAEKEEEEEEEAGDSNHLPLL